MTVNLFKKGPEGKSDVCPESSAIFKESHSVHKARLARSLSVNAFGYIISLYHYYRPAYELAGQCSYKQPSSWSENEIA